MEVDDGPADRPPQRRPWRVVLRVLGVLGAVLLLAVGGWVLLLPETEQVPLAAVEQDTRLVVTRTQDAVTLAPAGGGADTTVVFYPGAGVAPDAYLPTWALVVASTQVTVVLPTMPLRLAVLDADAAEEVRGRADDASTTTWWLGGHSLGGAMAASHLAGTSPGLWDGLVLWAAYPAGDDLVTRSDLAVLSVSGSEDGLTTPDEVEASRAALPVDARFVELDGVSHAQFGAYGEQRGDGTPRVDDETARRLVATATAEALAGS